MTDVHSVLTFDGKDDYVELPVSSIPEGKEISLSFWAKGGSSQPKNNSVFYAGFPSRTDVRIINIHLPWEGHICWDCGSDGSTNNRISKAAQTKDVKDRWTHWAFTLNANTGKMVIYLDGELWCEGSNQTKSIPKAGIVQLGHGYSFYPGSLSDVRVWNRELTQAEIKETMSARLTGKEPGLVSYWPLHEGTGTQVTDKTGHGHHGTIHGATWETAEVPITHQLKQRETHSMHNILSFDGKDDYIATNLDAQPKALPDTTWEAWVKPTGDPNAYGVFLSTDDGYWDRLVCIYTQKFGISNGNNLWLPVAFDFERWQHIAVVYTASKDIKFYKNGAEYIYSGKSSIGDTHNTFHIGHNSAGNVPFQGSICEVRIWNCVRTPSEIEQNMHRRLKGNEPGLVGYWPLNEGSGETASDRSASSNNGTIHGATWEQAEVPITRKLKQRETHSVQSILSFDGNDNYIDCGDGINLVDSSFTLECWAKRQKPNQWHLIFFQGDYTKNKGLHFGFRNTNVFTLAFHGNDLNSPTTYTDTDWHHWCGVYDFQNQQQILYLDGNEICQRLASPLKGTGIFYIGSGKESRFPFEGKLGELRVWKCVRTPAEIEQNMHRRLKGNEDGLVGYWPLNEGSGETLGDRSANSNHGTIHGATWEQAEVPIQERPSQQFQGTGLADYGYWYHWEKNLPKPTEKKPFRRGRIWA